MIAHGFGYKPDPADARDLLLAARLAPMDLGREGTVWSPRANVKGQRRTSSCVGQSVAQGKRLAYLRQGIDCPELSGRAAYRLALTVDGTDADEGTHLRSAIRAVQKLGCPTEAAWPFSEAAITAQLTPAAVHSGYDHRGLRGYYRIARGDADGIRRALFAGFPVVAGWSVGPAFMAYTGKGLVDIESEHTGGHALCLHSYAADTTFRGVNSWTTAWGQAGHFTATERWVCTATDVWALDVGGAT